MCSSLGLYLSTHNILLSKKSPFINILYAATFIYENDAYAPMKAVDVDFKKIDVVDYYPQFDQVKVRIVFDDGKEVASIKQMSITEPEKHAAEWLKEIRDKLKDKHKELSLDDHPLAGHLILRYKQEEDVLQNRVSRFLAQVREKIRSAKLANLSYMDTEKKVKGFTATF